MRWLTTSVGWAALTLTVTMAVYPSWRGQSIGAPRWVLMEALWAGHNVLSLAVYGWSRFHAVMLVLWCVCALISLAFGMGQRRPPGGDRHVDPAGLDSQEAGQ